MVMDTERADIFDGRVTRVYRHTVAVWIPGMTKEKTALSSEEIDQWINRFLSLFSILFGGGTAFGVRKSELCSVIANQGSMDEAGVYSSMGTIEGGYIPNIEDEKFSDLRKKISSRVGWSPGLLAVLSDANIDREPVSVVEAYVEDNQWTPEAKQIVVSLAVEMGRATQQHEVGCRFDDEFYTIKPKV
jgi:hypothetical protein